MKPEVEPIMQEKDPHGTVPDDETSAIPGRHVPETETTRQVIGDEGDVPERDVMGERHEPEVNDVMGETEEVGPDAMGTRRPRADKALGDDRERIEE